MRFPGRAFAQMGLVAILTMTLTFAVGLGQFRSGWNLLWMLGLPFVVARALDRGDGIWGLAGLWLLLWSFAVMAAKLQRFVEISNCSIEVASEKADVAHVEKGVGLERILFSGALPGGHRRSIIAILKICRPQVQQNVVG